MGANHVVGAAGPLAEAIDKALRQAQLAYPAIAIDLAPLATRINTLVEAMGGEPMQSLQALRIDDLFLAAACAQNNVAAIAEINDRILPQVEPALRSMGATPTLVDDAMQALRDTLFVGSDSKPPAIASYAGRAQLRTWIRSIAVRTASKLLASKGHDKAAARVGDEVLAGVAGVADPELDYLKARYGHSFRACLQAQLAELDSRQRNILRQHYIDGLNIDQLGVLYSVHRATAARWLAATREALLEGTRDRLMAELDLSRDEFESIARLVRSQLDLSLHRLL